MQIFKEPKSIFPSILQSSMENTSSLEHEIKGAWGTIEKFCDKGFGFCAHTDDLIVNWCTAEYLSQTSCGIGIETISEFQHKGIASKAVYHFVEKCRKLNLIPYWDSWKDNFPSVKVAEKQGFIKLLDYKVIYISKQS
ncbi:GNAT family N-acetyltransferase [Paenibacillus sp. Soil522]|uniref:GNAT family N-acetyltransferase n=1 Tax=Paenibacillus sp. Soil522 TaxID=1736388 RepID=UPI0007005689|nr:GNAT family N-acetyltransferase [Paenibacillus sp. Soil522]KRE37318.1 hypothetical protein ASG81_20150 [Paenibacillus sp. Soil522]